MENLADLIDNRGFENYQSGLEARFLANGMIYNYDYKKGNNYSSIILILSKNAISTQIEIRDNGKLIFQYQNKEINQIEEFNNCSSDDFHTMIAHAFIYLRDHNFDYHKEWYNKLHRK